MSSDVDVQRGPGTDAPGRTDLWMVGGLLTGGLLLTVLFTAFHPSGDEDNHQVIFAKYAASDAWVAVHLGQFIGVLLALGGLLALHRILRASDQRSLLADLAAGTTVATAAIWAVLQGLDGVALKQAVDAWNSASGSDEPLRFATAETVRWLEWGFQSYFRVLLGLAFVLTGVAILTGRLVAGWLGWAAMPAGLCSVSIGIDVGYSGLASGAQDALSLAFLVAALTFAVGLLVSGVRERGRRRSPT
jgi:hypothetical protein